MTTELGSITQANPLMSITPDGDVIFHHHADGSEVYRCTLTTLVDAIRSAVIVFTGTDTP